MVNSDGKETVTNGGTSATTNNHTVLLSSCPETGNPQASSKHSGFAPFSHSCWGVRILLNSTMPQVYLRKVQNHGYVQVCMENLIPILAHDRDMLSHKGFYHFSPLTHGFHGEASYDPSIHWWHGCSPRSKVVELPECKHVFHRACGMAAAPGELW